MAWIYVSRRSEVSCTLPYTALETRTSAPSVRCRRIESFTICTRTAISPAIAFPWAWYQSTTICWSRSFCISYRFTVIGAQGWGRGIVTIEASSGSQPAPGKQFFGEWGWAPFRWLSQ